MAFLHFLLLFLLTPAFCRDLHGGYERMFFWKAYELEVSKTGGPTTHIAKGCRGSGPGGSCLFNEFIKHINNMRSTPNIAQGTVDEMATRLNNRGLTSKANDYQKLLIVNSNQGQMPSNANLLRAIGDHIHKDLWPGTPTPQQTQIKNEALHSINVVRKLRSRDWAKHFKDTLRQNGVVPELKKSTIGGVQYNDDLDYPKTKKKDPTLVQQLVRSQNDPSQKPRNAKHWTLMSAASSAYQTVARCTTRTTRFLLGGLFSNGTLTRLVRVESS